jgi:replicative superfamily II helicase
MNKSDYLMEKGKELKNILEKDTKLISYTNQIFAKRIKAVFEERYDENYLWRYALYLSSKGSTLLEENFQNTIGIESLKRAAEIYESLYYVSQKYDKAYSLILSSLCYDLSGYQANAQCLIDRLVKESQAYYSLEKIDKEYEVISEYENKILKTIQLFLQKKIFLFSREIDNLYVENLTDLSSHYRIAFKDYQMATQSLSTFILIGKRDKDFLESITNSYKGILYSGNVLLSHIIGLFKTRLRLLKERNIWDVMDNQGKLPNPIWEKYLKLLSMDVYDIDRIKPEEERTSIFEFWKSQLKALNEGAISTNKNFVIQMPTSSGKTLIAEIMIINSLIENSNSKCIYIAPFRALTTEIEETLTNRLGKLGFIVSGATGSYEVDEFQQFWINNSDVLVATPEKIDLLYRLQPEFFENISLVVIDEGHIIGDISERSLLLEFLIVKLRRKLENKSRFLFISAVMTEVNAKEFSKWLSGTEDNVISLPKIYDKEWEPTRKLIGMCRWYKVKASGEIIYPYEQIELRKPLFLPNIVNERKYSYTNSLTGRTNTETFPNKNNKSETAVELSYKFVDEGPVLIFSSRPDWAKSTGKAFLRLLNIKEKSYEDIKDVFSNRGNIESLEMAKKWLGKDDIVTKCLIRGVGIHYGSLPEPVRKSIEKDFREKQLEVLISTNTIGQGVNFPIKTAIIHSLEIDPRVRKKVSIKDFWNIAGRAGRAGRETEGQIIFLAFDEKDEILFEKYTDKVNIEHTKSLLLLLLKSLVDKRIPSLKFEKDLEYYFEPSLLNLLAEETVDTLDEKRIKEILGYSLFIIQSKKEGYDIAPLVEGMLTIGRKFYSQVEDSILRKVYSKTGFHLSSCNKLSEFIESNIDELKEIIENGDYESLLQKSLDIFLWIDEMNEEEKLDSSILKENNEILSDFVIKWIEGVSINKLKTLWDNSFSETKLKDKMQLYINQFLNYRYPWGITVFLFILIYHLNRHFNDILEDFKDLPEKVRNLSSFIKYGLNNIPACMAKSIGVSTREASLKIGDIYSGENGFEEFIIWFANLDITDIKDLDISEFEIRNILYLSQKLNIKKWATEIFEPIKCDVKGIPYEESRKKLSREVDISDILTLERDFENPYDIYAIKSMFKNIQLGFIPRDIAKILAIEMDLNGRKFQAKIIDKSEMKDYYFITIEISKYNNR